VVRKLFSLSYILTEANSILEKKGAMAGTNETIMTTANTETSSSSDKEWLAELPDAEMNLFVQDLGPKIFVIFRKLPPELRNMIWRVSFPAGRRIKARVDPERLRKFWRYTHRTPVTFHVNRESREESKRGYECIFEPETTGASIVPLYFRASVDSLMVSDFKVFGFTCYFENVFLPEETKKEHQKIRFLEIQNPCWPDLHLFRQALLLHEVCSENTADFEEEANSEFGGWFSRNILNTSNFMMTQFPNLEILSFIIDEEDELASDNKPRDIERCKRGLEEWYAREKELKAHVQIPEIEVRYERVSYFDN
jgi:hypothetical protein